MPAFASQVPTRCFTRNKASPNWRAAGSFKEYNMIGLMSFLLIP